PAADGPQAVGHAPSPWRAPHGAPAHGATPHGPPSYGSPQHAGASHGSPQQGSPTASPLPPYVPATPGAGPGPSPRHPSHDPASPYPGAYPAPLAGPGGPGGPHGPGAPRAPRRRRPLSAVWAVPLVVLALVAGVVGGVLGSRLGDDDHLQDAGLPTTVAGAADLARAPESVAGIAAGVLPSVVSIEVDGPDGTSTGSGFVLRADGYLVTNNHVVAQAAETASTSVVVTFVDGSEEPASIVGRTSEYDLAVLKVEVSGLTPLLLGDSDAVVVGDPVVAVGAPLGLAGTVTTGIVSALNRPVSAGDEGDTAFINAIQTDAAINPGNSGGPLVNARGEVIGVNSAIAQPPGTSSVVGGSIGLGFAIPSEQVRRTAEQLIETGQATYPIIGVLLDQRYDGEGVQVSTEDQEGTPAVTPDGPADRSGIRRGDVILAIDGRPVTDPDELIVAIRARTPGETVVLHVRTGSDERDVRIRLDEAEAR
ncbi:S1C family serine protease, partial [Cellulomonas biazotea]